MEFFILIAAVSTTIATWWILLVSNNSLKATLLTSRLEVFKLVENAVTAWQEHPDNASAALQSLNTAHTRSQLLFAEPIPSGIKFIADDVAKFQELYARSYKADGDMVRSTHSKKPLINLFSPQIRKAPVQKFWMR